MKRYIVQDPLGSPRLVLDEKGAVVDKPFYDPFGGRVDASGKPLNVGPDPSITLGYTAQEEDGGGLINMRGRIYDRRQYRFLTPDPIVSNSLFGQSSHRKARHQAPSIGSAGFRPERLAFLDGGAG